MSSESNPALTLFKLHGLAVSLRDRADIPVDRTEALLLQIEHSYMQQLAGAPVDLGELLALTEAVGTELDTNQRLGEKLRRTTRRLVIQSGTVVVFPKLCAPERVLRALPTLSDAAATLRRAIPRARLTTLARDLTDALGKLALAATQGPVTKAELGPLRDAFARLDGLPQALAGVRERLGAALAEIDEE